MTRLPTVFGTEQALFAPGAGWHYSNTDCIILGLIIEQVTGNSYADELRSRFLQPLGMDDTYLYEGPEAEPQTTGNCLWRRGEPRSGSAGDSVLDAEHRLLMQTVVPQSRAGIPKQVPQFEDYLTGYGLGMFEFDYEVGTGYGHPGNIQGFASSSVYLPGDGNDFAMTLIASEVRADVVAEGGDAMAIAFLGSALAVVPSTR